MRGFIKFIITIAVIAGIVYGGYLYALHTINTHTSVAIDANASPEDYVVLEIRSGMRPSDVVDVLYEEDLIRNNTIAGWLVRLRGWGFIEGNWNAIQAGEYQVYAGQSLEEMFAMFTAGNIHDDTEPVTYVIIPEGAVLTWIAHLFERELEVDANDLLALWSDADFLTELIEEYWFLTDEILNPELYYPLEGYIYPIRHEIPVSAIEAGDKQAITRAALNMTQHRLAGVHGQIEASEMTFHEILSFAAIIEAETQVPTDMPGVVGVFQNRLDNQEGFGRRLETDATIQYLLEERVTQVLWEHLEIDSPFNTYRNPGLPPGPINSPSHHAIAAVLNPMTHGYYFFITDMFGCYIEEGSDATYSAPGKKIFAVTYAEHQANLARYLQPSYNAGHSVCNPNVQFGN